MTKTTPPPRSSMDVAQSFFRVFRGNRAMLTSIIDYFGEECDVFNVLREA